MVHPKVFNDPIHSSIQMPKHCQMIIDTPEFQRLRFIKQLGCTCYVFPSAVHTRFEHSIGVSHFAGKLAKMLQQDDPRNDIQDSEVRCVEIAALCHDLGHGPYFSAFEDIAPPDENGKKWMHEEQSVIMFKYLIEHNDLRGRLQKECNVIQSDLDFIYELILGRPEEEGTKLRRENKFYLHQIVNNRTNKIDVNKWDYLARDSLYLGMKSAFDFNRILPFIKVFEVERGGESRKELCFRDKVKNDLNHMFLTRRRLHYAAYKHRVTNVVYIMMKDAFKVASDNLIFFGKDGVRYSLLESVKDPMAFSQVDDTIINEIMRSRSQEPGMVKAREILDRIHKRELYQCIGTYQYASDKPIKKDTLDPAKIKQAIVKMNTGEIWMTRNIEVEVSYFDFGDEGRNPLLKIPFYGKSNGNKEKGILLPKEELPIDQPQQLQDVTVTVYTKVQNINRETLTDARKKGTEQLQSIIQKIIPADTVDKFTTLEGNPNSLPIRKVSPVQSPKHGTTVASNFPEAAVMSSNVHHKEFKDAFISVGSTFIDLTKKSIDPNEYGELILEQQEEEETPPDLSLRKDEVIISSGLFLATRGVELSRPMTIKMAHSAIFTKPEYAEIVFYTKDIGSREFKRLPSSVDGYPRCVVREKDLDFSTDHFSWWWIVAVIGPWFIGKWFICTPFIPVVSCGSLTQCMIVIGSKEPKETLLKGFIRASPASTDNLFLVEWRKGDLGIVVIEQGREVVSMELTETQAKSWQKYKIAVDLTVLGTGDSQRNITVKLKQNSIQKEKHFGLEFKVPSRKRTPSAQIEDDLREAQERTRILETERKLFKLAAHVPTRKYHELSNLLGIKYDEAEGILIEARGRHKEAMRECLAKWKTRTAGYELDELKQFLVDVELRDLQKYLD